MYYHSTQIHYCWTKRDAVRLLRAIRDEQYLEPKTTHAFNGNYYQGMSVTRNKDLAFKSRIYGGLVLELDPDTLRYNNRVMPIDGNVAFHGEHNGRGLGDGLPFGSDDFLNSVRCYRTRITYYNQPNGEDLAEEFVLGRVKNFRRHVRHAYILEMGDTHTDEYESKLQQVEELLSDLDIPVTYEDNPNNITNLDITKLHINQRKAA